MHTFMWITVYLAAGLIALSITAHVYATDAGLATIRARLRLALDRRRHSSRKDTSHETAS